MEWEGEEGGNEPSFLIHNRLVTFTVAASVAKKRFDLNEDVDRRPHIELS